MSFLGQALLAFIPAILEYVARRERDNATHEVALMHAIAKLEDDRAKEKFPDFKGSE